jgi:ankyrin repeat protein
VCQFQAFQNLRQASKVRQALRDLPNGLDETYIRMLLSIDPDYHHQVTFVLEWLAFSLRPLSIGELAEAFVTDPENSPPFGERLFTPEDMLEYLPGLVTTVATRYDNTRAHNRIRLAHFSIKEYLVSKRIRSSKASHFAIVEQEAHTHIAESCLAYHLQASETEIASPKTIEKYMLWEYAAQYWARHLELLDRSSWTERLILWAMQVLTEKSAALLNTVRVSGPIIWGKPRWEWGDLKIDALAPPLYYTTVWNCCQLTSHLLHNGARIDDIGGEHGTALNAAAYLGHAALLQILLDANPDVNLRIERYGTTLITAARGGDTKIVKLLLQHGSDIDLQDDIWGAALQAAARHGHDEIACLLLARGADVNAQGGEYGNAMQAAAYCGLHYIIDLLIGYGAHINANGGKYGSALQAASYGAKWSGLSTMSRLLELGADVNQQGGIYGNALQAASYGLGTRPSDRVQLLLDHGAHVNAQGGRYGNALQAAVFSKGGLKIVRILLKSGADVSARGGQYGNALQAAVIYDCPEIVQLLLAHGAKVDPPDAHWEELLDSVRCQVKGDYAAARLEQLQEEHGERSRSGMPFISGNFGTNY